MLLERENAQNGAVAVSRRGLLLGATATLVGSHGLRAQDNNWPTRPLRIIVPTAPGGSPDIAARIIGEKISNRIGKPVVVESMATGGGVPGFHLVARANDNHTFAMLTGGFATQAAMLENLPYRPLEDFTFIAAVVRYPIVFAVKPDSPIKNFQDYIDRARADSKSVSSGTAAPGSIYHLLSKWIDNVAGIDVNVVFYRGTAPALQDVLGGRIDVLIDASTSTVPRILEGQLRALAVSSPERFPLLPDVPTMAEFIPTIRAESWLGLAGPATLPISVTNRLNAEFQWALAEHDVQQWAHQSGVLTAPSTPGEFKNRVERDIKLWAEIVVRNNIKI